MVLIISIVGGRKLRRLIVLLHEEEGPDIPMTRTERDFQARS